MTIPFANFFVSYQFFRRIDASSKLKLSPDFLAVLFGLVTIASWIPWVGLLIFVPLGLAQYALNRSESTVPMRWSRGEIIACTVLVILFLSTVPLLVFGIRTYVISPFELAGNAMADTLHDSDYVLVSKWVYRTSDPQRGDIVVFRPPSDANRFYLKRIVGLPNETLVIRDGSVFIMKGSTETKLDEPYLNDRNQGRTIGYPVGSGDPSEVRYEIPDGHYFVMGDNRQASLDSRSFQDIDGESAPYIPRDAIIGKVFLVAQPTENAKFIEPPPYPPELR